MIVLNKISVLLFIILFYIKTIKSDTECDKEGSSRSPILQLKKKLLCNYDKDYRPIKDQTKPINVKIRLVLKTLDVTDDSHSFDMHSWMGLVWKDEFLTWNPSEYPTVKVVHIPSSEIWLPDLNIIKKHKDDKSAISDITDCIVRSSGLVTCVSDNLHEDLCTNNIDRWPYDTRTCSIRYSTGVYNNSQITIQASLIKSAYFENPSWKLLNASLKIYNKKNPINDETSNYVKYKFELERHSARTIAIIYIPAISLIILTLLPLWMEPGSVERFCLVSANIFSHFLYIQHMSYIAPISGSILPRIVSFYRDSLGLSVAVLIELTLIKSLLSNRTTSAPKWLLTPCNFLSQDVFRGTLLTNETTTTTTATSISEVATIETTTENGVPNDNKEAKIQKTLNEKFMIATIIDRFLFIILSVVYFILAICLIPL